VGIVGAFRTSLTSSDVGGFTGTCWVIWGDGTGLVVEGGLFTFLGTAFFLLFLFCGRVAAFLGGGLLAVLELEAADDDEEGLAELDLRVAFGLVFTAGCWGFAAGGGGGASFSRRFLGGPEPQAETLGMGAGTNTLFAASLLLRSCSSFNVLSFSSFPSGTFSGRSALTQISFSRSTHLKRTPLVLGPLVLFSSSRRTLRSSRRAARWVSTVRKRASLCARWAASRSLCCCADEAREADTESRIWDCCCFCCSAVRGAACWLSSARRRSRTARAATSYSEGVKLVPWTGDVAVAGFDVTEGEDGEGR